MFHSVENLNFFNFFSCAIKVIVLICLRKCSQELNMKNALLHIKVMSIACKFCVQYLNHQVYLRINGLIFIISSIEMFLFLERFFQER